MGNNYMVAVSAFSLGLFVDECMRRWWDMRSRHLQTYLTCSRKFLALLQVFTQQKEVKPLASRLTRYVLLAFHMLIALARARGGGPDVLVRAMKEACADGVVTAEELQRITGSETELLSSHMELLVK